MGQMILGHPAAIYGYFAAGLFLAFGLVKLGHRILDLLRDWRNFRNGK
jgi:hypothetical protein